MQEEAWIFRTSFRRYGSFDFREWTRRARTTPFVRNIDQETLKTCILVVALRCWSMSHGLVYPSTSLVRRFDRRIHRRHLHSLPFPDGTVLLFRSSPRCTHLSHPLRLFTCMHVACFVHAKHIQRTSSHKSPRVPPQLQKGCIWIWRCNCAHTPRKRGASAPTSVQRLGATASPPAEGGCNCFKAWKRGV